MPEKIKVIHVIPTLGFGGAERLVLDLIKRFDRDKYDLQVVAMVSAGGLEEAFRDTGVSLKIFYKKNKLGLGVFFKLVKYFKAERPQIVHTHLFGADVWAGFAAYCSGVPHIIKTEHNLNITEGAIKKFMKKITAFVFEKMVAVSPAVVEYMVDVEKMPKDKIKIIYNGIDINRFKPKKIAGFSSPTVLINVSRFEEQKGHKYLIEALQMVEDIDWQLWLVGDGSLRNEIEGQVEEAGLGDRIKFYGNRTDVPELLAKADVFVFSSLWEGLGLAVLEAGAVGLPIVATKVGGVKDVFKDNETAQLVDAKDSVALAKAISWVLEHPDKAAFMGRKAHEMVQEQYSLVRMIQEYEHLYDSL